MWVGRFIESRCDPHPSTRVRRSLMTVMRFVVEVFPSRLDKRKRVREKREILWKLRCLCAALGLIFWYNSWSPVPICFHRLRLQHHGMADIRRVSILPLLVLVAVACLVVVKADVVELTDSTFLDKVPRLNSVLLRFFFPPPPPSPFFLSVFSACVRMYHNL